MSIQPLIEYHRTRILISVNSFPLLCRGFYHDDTWGHRASEPQKAVICSLALARLRTDIKGNDSISNNSAVGMAQKLLLFWRKPARRCWWEGVELPKIDGVEGKVKVWIRRVWTLEMVCVYLVMDIMGLISTECNWLAMITMPLRHQLKSERSCSLSFL